MQINQLEDNQPKTMPKLQILYYTQHFISCVCVCVYGHAQTMVHVWSQLFIHLSISPRDGQFQGSNPSHQGLLADNSTHWSHFTVPWTDTLKCKLKCIHSPFYIYWLCKSYKCPDCSNSLLIEGNKDQTIMYYFSFSSYCDKTMTRSIFGELRVYSSLREAKT